jgi:hypothetical protein
MKKECILPETSMDYLFILFVPFVPLIFFLMVLMHLLKPSYCGVATETSLFPVFLSPLTHSSLNAGQKTSVAHLDSLVDLKIYIFQEIITLGKAPS